VYLLYERFAFLLPGGFLDQERGKDYPLLQADLRCNLVKAKLLGRFQRTPDNEKKVHIRIKKEPAPCLGAEKVDLLKGRQVSFRPAKQAHDRHLLRRGKEPLPDGRG
jgi:hypothetical protein